jgi:predicted  nucleic acid-binding Zn-ribbon protein
MPTIEERVAGLEKMIPDLRDEMRRGFDQLNARFDAVDQRFDAVDKRLDRIENRVERLDDRTDRHFLWIVGIQFTMLMLFVGALLTAVLRGL